jgi:hypothetical protein
MHILLAAACGSVYYSDVSGALPDLRARRCDLSCLPTNNAPDIVLFDARGARVPTKAKAVGVLLTESCLRYPFKQHTDATLTYRLDSVVPFLGMMYDTAQTINSAKENVLPVYSRKVKRPMMSVWISARSDEYRVRTLAVLKSYGVTSASYGSIGDRSASTHDGVEPAPWIKDWDDSNRLSGPQKQAHSAGHLFLYAAENTIDKYYHTEKVWHGLMAGTVPIYIGADTIDEYVPTHSIIKISSFRSVQHAADYILAVAKNKTRYYEYLAWRKAPLEPHVVDKLNLGKRFGTDEWKCTICKAFHALYA